MMGGWGLEFKFDYGAVYISFLPWIHFDTLPVLLHVKTASAFMLKWLLSWLL